MSCKTKPDFQPCCKERTCKPVTSIKSRSCASGSRGEPDPRQFSDPRFNGSNCPTLSESSSTRYLRMRKQA